MTVRDKVENSRYGTEALTGDARKDSFSGVCMAEGRMEASKRGVENQSSGSK